MEMAGKAGVDMISVTVGWQEAPESSIGRDRAPGSWNYLAARAKKLLPDTPICFGNRLPDPAMANDCIKNGEFDFWEVCRPFLADPELLHKAAEGRMEENRRCVGQLHCLSRLFRDLPYECTMNPHLGHEVEPDKAITPAAIQKNIMVIGAGPAGMECAITACKRGHTVTVYDKYDGIGGNFRSFACHDLANRDDLQSIVRYYETMAKKLGIIVKLGTEVTPRLMRNLLHTYDVAVIATGARIDEKLLPPCDKPGMLVDALDVAAGRVKVGKRVVVLGGGKVGLVLAESLKADGHEVALVEQEKRIAMDAVPAYKWRHSAWIEELEIPVLTGTTARRVVEGGVHVADAKGEERLLEADTVIGALMRVGNQELFHELEWMVDEVHGCGDAMVPRGLTQAIRDGYQLGVRL
jgi:2,4-dienoyl-CoA reductase (NADPH2)